MKTLLTFLLTASVAIAQTVSPAAKDGSNITLPGDWKTNLDFLDAADLATGTITPKTGDLDFNDLGGTIDNEAANAAIEENPIASLRAIKGSGFNSEISKISRTWRLAARLHRDKQVAAGTDFRGRFRALTLGDSVAADITRPLYSYFGYGGSFLTGPVKQASPTPADSNSANYTSWSDGVFTLYDEFARTVSGSIIHADSTFPNGTWVEWTGHYMPMRTFLVDYLAKDSTGGGDLSYGAFKLQYKINHAGAWTDCTSATISASGGSVASGVVTTDNNSATELYSRATFLLPAVDRYAIRLVATSGRVRWAGFNSDNGGTEGNVPGGSNFSFAAAGKQLASHFSQTPQSVMTSAVGLINPQVVMYKSANGWSLVNYETHWNAYASKVMAAAPNALFVVCGSHPRGSAPENLNASDIAVDDFLRNWCANKEGAVFVDIRQNFPAFNQQINLSGATGADAADINGDMEFSSTVNGYLAFAKTVGGATVTMQWNGSAWIVARNGQTRFTSTAVNPTTGFPTAFSSSNGSTGTLAYVENANRIDDLWSDGIHIYEGTPTAPAGGTRWVSALVWDAIYPALEYSRMMDGWETGNISNTMPGNVTEIRLTPFHNATSPSNREGKFSFVTNPRIVSSVVIRPNSATYNGGSQTWDRETGFYALASDDPDSPHNLGFLSCGASVMRFGAHSGFSNQYFGAGIGPGMTAARAKDGVRVLSPTQAYGAHPTLVAEGASGLAATTKIFGIDINATSSAFGTPLWSWFPDGKNEYEGVTSDANETTFVTTEPTADRTITYPDKTGTVAVILTGTGSLDYGSIAAGAEETLTVTVTGAVTTNSPSVSLGWSAALPAGVMVKQAWVSGADTVSITLANYMTVTAVDPPAITCRATVNNF